VEAAGNKQKTAVNDVAAVVCVSRGKHQLAKGGEGEGGRGGGVWPGLNCLLSRKCLRAGH
jgi:hypothetical protein